MQNWKMTDEVARVEIDGLENDMLTMVYKTGVNVNSGHKFICASQPHIAHFGFFKHSSVCTSLIYLLPYSLTFLFYSMNALTTYK